MSLAISLDTLFQELNALHFDAFLEPPVLRWNSRLQSSAGRFVPGTRARSNGGFSIASVFRPVIPPVIEVASYLRQEPNAVSLVRDTLAHEMIHYWLWVRRRPYGHTSEFYTKMKIIGCSRYNSSPRRRPYKYVYRCLHCSQEFKARRKLGPLACAKCCKQHNHGRYDARFKLYLSAKIPVEASTRDASREGVANVSKESFPEGGASQLV